MGDDAVRFINDTPDSSNCLKGLVFRLFPMADGRAVSMTFRRTLVGPSACSWCPVVGWPSHIPDLGDVSGTVTLDGRPFAKAHVAFEPGMGRQSIGITDGEGP